MICSDNYQSHSSVHILIEKVKEASRGVSLFQTEMSGYRDPYDGQPTEIPRLEELEQVQSRE